MSAVVATVRRAVWCMLAVTLVACGGGGGGGGGDDEDEPVAPAPVAPTITLAPLTGTTQNRTVTLSANVTAPAGVTRVEFLVDGTVIGAATAAPFQANWNTSTVSDGNHSITARVTDAANTTVTSAPVTANVMNTQRIAVTMSPGEIFPRPNSTATGSGEVRVSLVTGAVEGSITTTGVVATLTHIHAGYAGTDGPVLINFAQDATHPSQWNVVANAMFTAEQVSELLAGRMYVNVHSAAYPAGEIRGQLKPQDVDVHFAALTGAQVVPPVQTSASGLAAITIDAASNHGTVHANTMGVDDADAAHVHLAAAGQTASTPLLTLAKDPADPSHWSSERQTLSTSDRQALTNNQWYVDVHTPGSPAGALRGQVAPGGAPTPPPAVTLTQLQTDIFGPRCASCHSGSGAALPGSMNLTSAAATHAALVGVNSTQRATLQRVRVNDANNSYLIHKLEGAPSIAGSRMPLGGPFLDAATIERVKEWINAGASNN